MVKNNNKKVKKKKKEFHIFDKIPYLLLLIILTILYAKYIGVRGITVKDYSITSSKIPESFDGFSIVHFGDLKIGTTFNVSDLKLLVSKINKLKPDIVVFTGDICSNTYTISNEEKNSLIENLKEIDPLISKYSVRGDVDTIDSNYNDIMGEAGFKDLTNSYELIYYKGLTPIALYGLDSMLTGNPDYEKTFAYPTLDENPEYMANFRILLAHEPDAIENISNYNISLMLAGHSKNSEVNIPYLRDLYNIKGASKYYAPKYNVNGTKLFITSGLGTSKYKMRLLSRPSISIYRLYNN